MARPSNCWDTLKASVPSSNGDITMAERELWYGDNLKYIVDRLNYRLSAEWAISSQVVLLDFISFIFISLVIIISTFCLYPVKPCSSSTKCRSGIIYM
jgi:hypothetical protein